MTSPLPNRFRQRILARERLIGFWVCMSSHITAELAGLAEGLAELLGPAIGAARERLASCACEEGCPSCVGVDFGEAAGPQAARGGRDVKASVLGLLEALSAATAAAPGDGQEP